MKLRAMGIGENDYSGPTTIVTALFEAVASGNASRAVVLYDRLRPVVSRTIRRLAPRSVEHEDLVQQAFLELVVSLRTRPQVRSLDAWYEAFDVKTGDKLYLAPTDRVRIW